MGNVLRLITIAKSLIIGTLFNMKTQIAFWPYDIYPFTLWGEIDYTRRHSYSPETLVYVPSYQGFFRPFLTLDEENALPIIKRLEELRANYLIDRDNITKQYCAALKDLIPNHPTKL